MVSNIQQRRGWNSTFFDDAITFSRDWASILNGTTKKKKNRRGKYIYIRNKIYLTHRYRNSHWCTTRHLFPLFQSNRELESLRTLEHEEERYAIEWITDEKSCEKKIRKLIGHWNSMPERNSGVSKSGGSWNHFYLSIWFSAITSIT